MKYKNKRADLQPVHFVVFECSALACIPNLYVQLIWEYGSVFFNKIHKNNIFFLFFNNYFLY